MKSLVIGNGSAAKRHRQVLSSLGHELVDGEADYVVIASLTPKHIEHLKSLGGFTGICLVEKPLFMKQEDFVPGFKTYVAYQLRFNPAVIALRKLLRGAKIYTVSIYAGQHFSLWGGTYHGDLSKGGGVLRDYSHELDLAQHIMGKIENVNSIRYEGQQVASIIFAAGGMPVSMNINYMDLSPRREWIIVTDRGTFVLDLMNHTINGKVYRGEDPTALMHKAVLGGGEGVCTFEEGLYINKIIDGMEA